MKQTLQLLSLVLSAFILSSCSSDSGSDALLFGKIPGIYVVFQSEVKELRDNPDLFKNEEAFKKADEKYKELLSQAEKDLTAAMETIYGKEFEVTCEAPLKVNKPLSLTSDGFFSKSGLEAKFKLVGEVVAEADAPAAFPQSLVDSYVRTPQIKPIGQLVELVGLDAEGNELYSFNVGSFPTEVADGKVIIKGGQPMENSSFHLSTKKGEDYLKAASLKLRLVKTE